ncbi:FAM172 family protein homolog CG10038 [Trichoplusia ni]|uniref:FAM172 family protein homolog CG10038 n=1 Tax=Trichoplusia ni TaxID=7111 RepID=A0A7E5VH27_TRINI|nr:FAM172 family protein homolog CG10038 [Trichoplusia ni]
MSHKHFNKLKVFLASSILPKRIWSQTSSQSYCAAKLKNMDAVKSMKDLGYAFNADGQLRKVDADGQPTDEPFQFNVSNQHQECQAHYEELGNVVTDYVYHLMENELNLARLPVPKDSQAGTFIFGSKDYDQKDVLLILIHGSGAVRAGQWARSLIINDNLDMGTQIPYIKKALSKDYGVLVLNPNDNCLPNGKKIPHSSTGEEHTIYVWNTYIKNTKATSIAVVAHSYGGVLSVTLADQLKKEFEKRVKAIAFTDSVHVYSNIKITKYLKEVARNWISSPTPLDTPMNTPEFDIPRVSAGHQKHEMTSYSCMESVFKFIEEKVSKQ